MYLKVLKKKYFYLAASSIISTLTLDAGVNEECIGVLANNEDWPWENSDLKTVIRSLKYYGLFFQWVLLPCTFLFYDHYLKKSAQSY